MKDEQKFTDLKTLAMMAARLAGRDPDQRVEIRIGGQLIFQDATWRYSDFLNRAKAAYELLDDGLGFESTELAITIRP